MLALMLAVLLQEKEKPTNISWFTNQCRIVSLVVVVLAGPTLRRERHQGDPQGISESKSAKTFAAQSRERMEI